MNGNVFDSMGIAPRLTTNKGEGTKVFLNQERYNEYKLSDTCQTARIGGDPLLIIEPRAVLTPDRAEKRQNGRRMKDQGEPMFTLTAQVLHGVAISVDLKNTEGSTRRGKYKHEYVGALDTNCHIGVTDGYVIRKLTPLECFRLQTYPVEWYVKLKLYKHPEYIPSIDITRNDVTEQVLELILREGIKEGMSDSQLYKMAGNGVTSAVAEDIGWRLLQLYIERVVK